MFSPCSVQQIGQPNASFNAGASEMSIEFEMSMTSGGGCEASQCSSLPNSFRCRPSSPSSTDTVRPPSSSGCVATPRCETARRSHGASHSRSIIHGVPRKSAEYCSR